MDVRTIIAKAAAGEILTPEEREVLSNFELPSEAAAAELPLLREQFKKLENERDAAQRELTELQFRGQVVELAARYGFTDPDYLGYLLGRKGISPDQPDEIDMFLAELKTQSPKLFRLELKAGAGTLPSLSAGNRNPLLSSLADEVARRLEGAPEIKF